MGPNQLLTFSQRAHRHALMIQAADSKGQPRGCSGLPLGVDAGDEQKWCRFGSIGHEVVAPDASSGCSSRRSNSVLTSHRYNARPAASPEFAQTAPPKTVYDGVAKRNL